jgi:hypothetical protein
MLLARHSISLRLYPRHKLVPELLVSGNLRAHNIDHRPGGLETIPDGLEELKAGKISGKKIVYTLG